MRPLIIALLALLLLPLSGCRRNVMRISTNPPGASLYVQGKIVSLEDSDRRLARKIDAKIRREKDLTEEEAQFQQDRYRAQATPAEYEFDSTSCGYSVYCLKRGYQTAYYVEYIKTRWYEWPVFDFIVDILPFTITDSREIEYNLVPVDAAQPPSE
jgi:hypothetical protein